jgi:hypothetical protein
MPTTDVRRARAERARLRAGVLRCGGLLGWPARAVIAVAEDLAGQRWKRCTRGELDAVLDQLQAVVLAGATRRDGRVTPAVGRVSGSAAPGRDHAPGD